MHHRSIHTQTANGQAWARTSVSSIASAAIPGHPAAIAAIDDLQFSSTTAAAQQAREQSRAGFSGAAAFSIAPCHIRLQPSLILQILLPTDVPRMMIHKQDLPLILRFSISRLVSRSSVFNHGSGRCLAVGKRTAVARISEHLEDSSAARQSPDNFLTGSASFDVWQ